MNILQWKQTTIAKAPDELSKAINKYTGHRSSVQKKGSIQAGEYDIVHFHNKTTKVRSGNTKKCIQYHSEPHRVRINPSNITKKFVVAQYHATLPEYTDCTPARNLIDFNSELYQEHRVEDKIRVSFSPSALTNNGYWYNKGYRQTKRVLERLKSEYPTEFDFNIISGESLEDCIRKKRKSNVVIDECSSPSYHRSGLEGLALGKYTICSLHSEVEEVLLNACGADNQPFFDVKITSLYTHLKSLIDKGPSFVIPEGKESREWMEKYWSPSQIAQNFVEMYENL